MADITYVCLSDLHLGEEDSLLTCLKETDGEWASDHLSPSPTLRALAACLKELKDMNQSGKLPTLVLAGDVLELALCGMHEAAMGFERFIEQTMAGERLFEKIIFLPGNHDHHLWELARETQYVKYLKRKFPDPGTEFPAPRHVTNLFAEKQKDSVESYFLTSLIRRFPTLHGKTIEVFYPNFGVQHENGRCVVFTHGHYTEWLYYLMSSLNNILSPDEPDKNTIRKIEAENFAWIDFFWSAMGRSDEVGQSVEGIYERLQSEKERKRLVDTIAKSVAEKVGYSGWLADFTETKLLAYLLNQLAQKLAGTERRNTRDSLGFKTDKDLNGYVTGPLRKQILEENNHKMPGEVSLVFGHTHKPFQKDMQFDGYPGWVNVYNTGGWVVETVTAKPAHGGAVVLVDENLNAVSLNMYSEAEDPGAYAVSVAEARHTGDQANPLYIDLKKRIDPTAAPWRTFSKTIAPEIVLRQRYMAKRIKNFGNE